MDDNPYLVDLTSTRPRRVTPKPAPKPAQLDYDEIIGRHARRTNLDPFLIRSVIEQESSFKPRARSPKGARGVMQLMPATARRFGVKNVNDPEENIRGGTDYLKFLHDRYGGDIDRVLAGYNAGEGAVDKFGGIPPYKETRNYVPSVKARYQKLQSQNPYLVDVDDEAESPDESPIQAADDSAYLVDLPEAPARPEGLLKRGTPHQQAQALKQWDVSRRQKPATAQPVGMGQVKAIEREQQQAEQSQRAAIRAQVAEEMTEQWPYGRPQDLSSTAKMVGKTALGFLAEPVKTVSSPFRDREKAIEEEVERRYQAQQRAESPEVVAERKALGTVHPVARTLAGPVMRAEAGLMRTLAGGLQLGGILPEGEMEKYLRSKAQFLEDVSSNPPLTAEGEEVVRKLPEKVTSAVLETGLSIAQIIALKRATGMPFGRLLAAETALKTTGQPAKERVPAITESYAMGKVLERHLSRGVSALAFGGPTAAQSANAYVQGKTSLEDALLETGIQAGVGAALGGKGLGGLVPRGLRGERARAETPEAREPVEGEVALQRFQHIQFGAVEVTPEQTGARSGRVRVAEVGDPTKIHYVKKSDLQGRGNARMIPVREATEAPAEPKAAESTSARDILRRYDDTGEFSEADVVAALEKAGLLKAETSRYREAERSSREEYGMRLDAGDTIFNKEVYPALQKLSGAPAIEKAATVTEPSVDIAPIKAAKTVKDVDVAAGKLLAGAKTDAELKQIAAAQKSRVAEIEAPRAPEPAKPAEPAVSEAPRAVTPPAPEKPVEKPPVEAGTARPSAETAQGKPAQAAEPSAVRAARERQAKRAAEKAQGIEYRRAGADPYELIDDLIVRGWDLYSQKIRPTFEEWSRKLKEEFGPASERHLKDVWAKLGGAEQPESTTSARKAQMAEDRAALDLPELPEAQRKSWQTSLDKAQPERASLLADEVLNRPRALSDDETASVVVRAQQIKNEHAAKMAEIGTARDEATITARRAEVEALEREFDKLTTATKLSGTEKGRALASQKLTINQEYDLVSLKQRAKAAKGRELTPEEVTRYEEMAQKISELETQLEKAQKAAIERSAQREINRMRREASRKKTREALDDEFSSLKTQLAEVWKATRSGVQPMGLAAIDPEGKLAPLIIQMARNRVQAGILDAETVVAEVHKAVREYVPDVSSRDIRDVISGYSKERQGDQRSELSKQLATVRAELKKISRTEDIAAGKQLSPQEKARRTYLTNREAELQRKLETKDYALPIREARVYTRETQALADRVNRLKAKYDRELYRAQRGTFGYAWDVGVNVANIPKTLKSMGDLSAVLRQGGYFSLTHPVLSAKAGADMLRSLTNLGFRNVERAIKAHPDFDLAKRTGVEFTGVDKDSLKPSEREEAYLSDLVSRMPIARQSEQTFVSFLDSQRMQMFARFADQLRSQGLTPQQNPGEFRAIAKFINIGTGRGSLGRRGNQIAPFLNTLMFSPRLLASRVQLLNRMINPAAIARTPPAARRIMIRDNVKFAGTIATALGLAAAAGAKVVLDPDDADFLKIRVGNTRYDILTGIQQPLRFIWRMAKAVQADVTTNETYAGEEKGELVDRFRRSKAAPVAGFIEDYIRNEDFQGRKFKLSRALLDLVTPLYLDDFREAMKEDGIIEAAIKTAPALVGVGAQTYKDAPEKPRTHAEKLARKFVRAKLPETAREEQQIDLDQKRADLRARARRGEDVSAEIESLGDRITERQAKRILDATDESRLQADVKTLGAKDAILVWSVMTVEQQEATREILEHKATLIDNLPVAEQEDVRQRYESAGIEPESKKTRTGFRRAFERRMAAPF